MKRKSIPPLKTEKEIDRFWATHGLADVLEDTEAVDEIIELRPDLARKIRDRSRKRLLTIRLEQWRVERAKKIARARGIPYQQLLREWISRGIRSEGAKRRLAQ